MAREIDMTCDGCGEPIAVNEHYMKVRIEPATRMPADWRPAVKTEPLVFEIQLHHPVCFMKWSTQNRTILNIYGQ